jgi:hypothetical protein
MKCPDCAAIEAFKKAVESRGWKWSGQQPCKACKGSGIVPDRPRPLKPRKKDLSGDEWLAADRQAEWEHYIMNERKDD